MPRLNRDEMKKLMDDVMVWVQKVEEMEQLGNESTGEVKSAYGLVHKDYLWKLQKTIGQLWYYVCGADEFSPFELPVETEEVKEEAKNEIITLPTT